MERPVKYFGGFNVVLRIWRIYHSSPGSSYTRRILSAISRLLLNAAPSLAFFLLITITYMSDDPLKFLSTNMAPSFLLLLHLSNVASLRVKFDKLHALVNLTPSVRIHRARTQLKSLTKQTRAPIAIYMVYTVALILVHQYTLHMKLDENTENNLFLKEKQRIIAQANAMQTALNLISQFATIFVFVSTDLTFFAVGVLMFQVVLIYLRHMRDSLNELRMRNRLELAAEMWPSQESSNVVDIKYLVCVHQYAIELMMRTSSVITPYVVISMLRFFVRVSSLIATYIKEGATVTFWETLGFFIFHAWSLFIMSRYGSLIEDENVKLNRMVQLKIAEPLPRGQQGHPDWKSLKVIEARTSLNMCPVLDHFIPLQINLSTYKRLHGFFIAMFFLLLALRPLAPKEK